jgi:hypothetical protein
MAWPEKYGFTAARAAIFQTVQPRPACGRSIFNSPDPLSNKSVRKWLATRCFCNVLSSAGTKSFRKSSIDWEDVMQILGTISLHAQTIPVTETVAR